MPWVTPKTDWVETYTDDGQYAGDWFNVEDYSRIKGNLEYLNALATEVYGRSHSFPDIPAVTIQNFVYASTIDVLERALDDLTTGSRFNPGIPPTQMWGGNDNTPRAADFNRIESSCLTLYTLMHAVMSARTKLPFSMGGSKF